MNELVQTPNTTPYGSANNSRMGSFKGTARIPFHNSNLQQQQQLTDEFSYSFINREFLDEEMMDVSHSPTPRRLNSALGFSVGGVGGSTAMNLSGSSFRNLTSTPIRSTPASLPKSLPLDWALFNKQYQLKQRRLKSQLNLANIQEGDQAIANSFENLPFQIIDFISDCVESQSDLVSLSQTCKFFNTMINVRLYKKILIIDDINSKFKHFDSNYTLLDLNKNFPKFLASLHSNPEELVPLIQEIIIDTSCTPTFQSYDELQSNIYDSLYDLFLTNDNNLQILENLDLSNLKKFGSLLKYNHDHLIKHNYNKYTYQYEDLQNSKDLVKQDILNLQNFQILNIQDLNSLPASCVDLSILVENEYKMNDDNSHLVIEPSTWAVLQNLSSLQLNTPTTYEMFINAVTLPEHYSKLNNIQTLSISSVHHNNNPISFDKLAEIIELKNIRNLELKLNCHERVLCNHCILNLFANWFKAVGDDIYLEKLSFISIPPSSQFNFQIQWDSILTEDTVMKRFCSQLRFFYINLNDFPFLPIFVKTERFELDRSNTLKAPINNTILQQRHLMFKKILEHLKKCEDLTIVDWFYNWLVYENIDRVEEDDDSGLNFLNYINTCHCDICIEGRRTLKGLVKETCFKDFKKRFETGLNYQLPEAESITDSNLQLIKTNPDEFRILYNHLLLSLKNRIPLNSQSSKISTSLRLDKFKQINELSTQLISKEKWDVIIKLICHSMRRQFKRIIQRMPSLKRVNLGGLVFGISRCDNSVKVRSVYDDYEEVFNL